MKKRKLVIGIIIGCIIVVGMVGFMLMRSVINTANHTTIQDIDVSTIKDGTYEGSYEISPVQVDVSVTIKQQNITNIVLLKHMNGLGKKGELITNEVIENQSLDVDVITGATVSSKCILKAIEQALIKENVYE